MRRQLVKDLHRAYELKRTEQSVASCNRASDQAGSPDALDSLLYAFCAWDYLESKAANSGIRLTLAEQILKRNLEEHENDRIKLEGWMLFRYVT